MLFRSALLGEVPLAIPRWEPKDAPTRQETAILKRVAKKRKLFGFLRLYRMRIFDEAFQAELDEMYRDTGAGLEPIPPALMAMVLILQGYLGVSDAEAVELTVHDLRWLSAATLFDGQPITLCDGRVRAETGCSTLAARDC